MNWGFKKFSTTEYEIKNKTSETARILEYNAQKAKKERKNSNSKKSKLCMKCPKEIQAQKLKE